MERAEMSDKTDDTFLQLPGYYLDQDFAKFIYDNPDTCRTLSGLDLEGCTFHEVAGPVVLARSLMSLPVLKALSLRLSNLMACKEFKALLEALGKHKFLVRLDIGGLKLSDQALSYIVEALTPSTSITTLFLDNNDIKPSGAAALGHLVQNNKFITYLDLSKNQIGNKGMSTLSQALKVNRHIETLNLDSNEFGNEGTRHLVRAVQSHPTLSCLHLRANKIGATGAQDLVDLLDTNHTIVDMDIRWNYIESDYMIEIDKKLQKNYMRDVDNPTTNRSNSEEIKSADVRPETNGEDLSKSSSLVKDILLPTFSSIDNIFQMQNYPNFSSINDTKHSFHISEADKETALMLSQLSLQPNGREIQYNQSIDLSSRPGTNTNTLPKLRSKEEKEEEYEEDFTPLQGSDADSRPPTQPLLPQKPAPSAITNTTSPLQKRLLKAAELLGKISHEQTEQQKQMHHLIKEHAVERMPLSLSTLPLSEVVVSPARTNYIRQLEKNSQEIEALLASLEEKVKTFKSSLQKESEKIDGMDEKLPVLVANATKLAESLASIEL